MRLVYGYYRSVITDFCRQVLGFVELPGDGGRVLIACKAAPPSEVDDGRIDGTIV